MTRRWTGFALAAAVCSMGAGPAGAARPAAAQAAATMTAHAAMPVQAASMQAQESRTTAQLLEEVRALRAAIERMTVSGTRAQLLLGRLQMQEQRMTSLGRQLQETRTKLVGLQRDRANHALEFEHLTERLERASTFDERLGAETGLKAVTQAMKQLDQQVNAVQLEDAGMSQALSTEQARWIELNGRLEELEGLLAAQKP